MIASRKFRFRPNKNEVRIPREDWELLRKNPAFGELIELIEDKYDLEEAKRAKGKVISLADYLKKRAIRNNS